MAAMNASSVFQLAFILQTSASSAQSALNSPIRKSLERWSERCFLLLLVSTAIVAVGLLFEWPEVKHDFGEWWRTRPSKNRWLVNLRIDRNRIPLWSMIGFALVTIGVALEGVFEGYVGITDTKLRKFDESAILAAEREAGDAAKSAQNARNAAKDAQDSANKLGRLLQESTATLLDAQAKLEKAESNDVESQNLRTGMLLKGTPIRSLNNSALAPLRKLPPSVAHIEFSSTNGTREYAKIIQLALMSAGWNVTPPTPRPDLPPGVTISNSDANVSSPTWYIEPTFTGEPHIDTHILRIQLKQSGVKDSDIEKFVALTVGLGAHLKKDISVPRNVFWIAVGANPEQNK